VSRAAPVEWVPAMRGFVAEGANVVSRTYSSKGARGPTLADELGDHAIFSRLDITGVAAGMHEDPFAPHTKSGPLM
jgi:hypothetical protein